MQPGSRVFDGYFIYNVLADSGDGWLSVSLHGHWFRIQKSQVVEVQDE